MADPSTLRQAQGAGLPADIAFVERAYRARDGSLHPDLPSATRQAVRLELQALGLAPYAVEALLGPCGREIMMQLQRLFA
jgi:hypothetical protein